MKNISEDQLTTIQEHDSNVTELNEKKWKEEFLRIIESKNRLTQKYLKMEEDLLHPIQKIGLYGKIWIGFLIALTLAGVFAYYLQETRSKYETLSIRDYTMWGVYIS